MRRLRDRDINPFAASSLLLSYDNRFVCGKYCNFATYDMPADGNFRASTGDGRVKFRGWGVSGQVEWDITEGYKLTSITASRKYVSNFSNDNDVSPMAHSLGYGPLTFKFFSEELRLNGRILDTIDYTIGGYYSDQKSVYTSFQDLRSSASAVPAERSGGRGQQGAVRACVVEPARSADRHRWHPLHRGIEDLYVHRASVRTYRRCRPR